MTNFCVVFQVTLEMKTYISHITPKLLKACLKGDVYKRIDETYSDHHLLVFGISTVVAFFFFNTSIYLFVLPLATLSFVAAQAFFSSCGSGGFQLQCVGFSGCRAQTVGHMGFSSCSSQASEHGLGLSCSTQHVGSSQIRDRTHISYVGR